MSPLYRYSGYYYTPSGKRSYINGVERPDSWEDESAWIVSAQIKVLDSLKSNPRRRYYGGLTFTHFERVE